VRNEENETLKKLFHIMLVSITQVFFSTLSFYSITQTRDTLIATLCGFTMTKKNTLYNLLVHVIPEELKSDVKYMHDDNIECVYSFTLSDKYKNIDHKYKITLTIYSEDDRILPKETVIHLLSGHGIEFIALSGGAKILLQHDARLTINVFDESFETPQLLKST
jgi:hypothetical protein